tara:strand:+ start:85013 stop:86005 length:993 start_codon:yes stop_codon:yes gene_type:complete
MFYDETNVKLRAGNGGGGCASFRREKYLPRGGPDGGDGGSGGDVILLGDENTGDLRVFHFKSHWDAENGQPGGGRHMSGRGGEHRILRVPLGLIVYDQDAGEVVAEVLEHDQEIILLKGGRGGLGNLHFKSSVHQAPRESTSGTDGEFGQFRFILKSIADVGLVGFPNAGKSSFTSIVTKATPKTAAYPFTTLTPNIGVIEYPEEYERLKLADIPGLIEGAHENRGLGHRFLRHIERCSLLMLIIDMAGEDGRDPADDYAKLREELRLYNQELMDKEYVVVTNKMDEPAAVKNLQEFRKAFDVTVWPISCLTEEGIPELKVELQKAINRL